MNKQLELLMQRLGKWPEEAQAEAVRQLQRIEQERVVPADLSPEEAAAIDAALEDVDAGRLATDAEVKALFRCHGA
ncbi:hypothetical protein [Xanthobacter oligotrophicus]|uniref:hypothetical protein n=1 Tax=Xanthobacter oligotrophicus TaxID=2607286 RepID=UPI0011F3893D|nr:hypothetical protein [Xanthobacter oligotrophicus]MCG5235712.1 hypothetical protein [Xanthobacter oligotrophicus]